MRTRLPQQVRRYAENAIQDPDRLSKLVRLTQTGEMQLRPGRWLPFEATHEAHVDRVEFEWRARFSVAPLVSVRVRDWCRDGDGGLNARLLGLIPVASAAGPETARSEAMRYLAELPWFPQAILANDDLSWRDVETGSVEVAASIGRVRVAVTLRFDGAGDIVGAYAPDRPRKEGERFVERRWTGLFADFRELAGVRVPTRAEVSWLLPEGPFTYFRGRITGIELV